MVNARIKRTGGVERKGVLCAHAPPGIACKGSRAAQRLPIHSRHTGVPFWTETELEQMNARFHVAMLAEIERGNERCATGVSTAACRGITIEERIKGGSALPGGEVRVRSYMSESGES
jgi:hypothetical protein